MSKLLEKVRQEISKLFEGKTEHFERTLYYVLVLKPKASKALQIAAIAHDIGRAKWTPEYTTSLRIAKMSVSQIGELHSVEGEKMIKEILSKLTKNTDLVKQVAFLVLHHEVGGTPDADLLMDADSVSYFETNAEKHLLNVNSWGKDLVREKLDFMFNRITSKKAKELARPMYEKVLKELEKYKSDN